MHRIWFLLLIILLTSAGYTAHADEGWEIVERCFGEATTPPEGWTFDGTLLLTSIGRLHAYRQGWETPRVLVFDQHIAEQSVLSPDGLWYAVVQKEKDNDLSSMATTWYRVYAIHVYSTVTDEKYVIPWESIYYFNQQPRGHGLYWLDNEHLLYSRGDAVNEEWVTINPFTGAIGEWDATFNPSWDQFKFSPDREKAVYWDWNEPGGWFYNGTHEISIPAHDADWSPNSTIFAAFTRDLETKLPNQYVLFDEDGIRTDVIFDLWSNSQLTSEGAGVTEYLETGWSPDNRYLVFGVQERLYIADIEHKQVIDACVISAIYSFSVAWSPDSSQFALTTYIHDDGIQIFDLAAWERYVVGYHSGDVIGWRGDD